VVIKGTSCAGAARIAKHLSCTETNERNELYELRGVAAEDLYGALREMEAVALGTRCKKAFYHASINTPSHERLTDEQRAYAIDRLESALGLSGQPRVIVIHHKRDCGDRLREHCHIVWSRIDLERMRGISDSHNFRKNEQVARDLEREFGHARVQGAHVEREGQPRPKRTPSHAEMRQSERSGLSVQAVKAAVTDIWRRTDSGRAFNSALQDAGYILARGDRRDFVVIDPKGGVHSLPRCVEGARAKDIRVRMADLDQRRLPSVAEVRSLQRERAGRQSAPVRNVAFRKPKTHRGTVAATTSARQTLGTSPAREAPARGAPHQRHAGFSGHRNRPHASAFSARSNTLKPPGLTPHHHIGRFEIRPSGFYTPLKQKPVSGHALRFGSGPGRGLAFPRAPPRIGRADEPVGSARLTTTSYQPVANAADSRAAELGTSVPDNSAAENIELAQILSAIAEEVYRYCAAICIGIEARFAARQAFARKTLPTYQITGALTALSAERQAALAAARQQAKNELFARSQTAKVRFGRRPPRPSAPPKAEQPGRPQPT
jgi:hypothetical protein